MPEVLDRLVAQSELQADLGTRVICMSVVGIERDGAVGIRHGVTVATGELVEPGPAIVGLCVAGLEPDRLSEIRNRTIENALAIPSSGSRSLRAQASQSGDVSDCAASAGAGSSPISPATMSRPSDMPISCLFPPRWRVSISYSWASRHLCGGRERL